MPVAIRTNVSGSKERVRSAILEASDLTGKAGSSIPRAIVTCHIVGYVETEKPNTTATKS